jgi:hypothetical protein
MTRRTNVRIAGFTFLFYIAVAFPAMVLEGRATSGVNTVARLASIAQHTTQMRIVVLLNLLSVFSALVLAVTLYAITRDEDQDLAMFGLVCRVGEGITGAFALSTLGLLWLATSTGPNVPDAAGAAAIATLLSKSGGWQTMAAATLFAAGSTAFAYLMLRGRMIPRVLAWLGVIASLIILIEVPLELAGFVGGPRVQVVWIPIALFELTLAPWLIFKGVAPPARTLPA